MRLQAILVKIKKLLLGVSLVAIGVGNANESIELPPTTYLVHKTEYSIAYDPRTRNPIYTHELLSLSSLIGRVSRDDCKFKEDTRIPEIFRSTLKDYKGSGYDRGHLAPAANHKHSEDAMSDTFYLSNMCPQDPKFNRGYWAKLEKYVRNLANSHKTVEVFSGPLYLPQKDNEGKKWVRYEVIGDNDVAVPTHFYKVIALSKDNDPGIIIEAYIMPNKEIPQTTPLNTFKTTIEKVEKASGVIFFTKQ